MNRKRVASSYLEIQVAMVLMAIGVSGLYSLSVIHTRQTARLEQVLPADTIASINPVAAGTPAETAWARKLGAYATIESDAVSAPLVRYPLNEGFEVIVDNEHGSSAFTTHEGAGSFEWDEYGGYSGDNEINVARLLTFNPTGSYGEFTITGITPGEYEVLLYLPRRSHFGSAVPHQIYDNSTLIDTVEVDQRYEVQDHERWGRWWERLGVYTFNSNTIRVRLLDTPTSGFYIVADAVMVRCRRSFDVVSEVSDTGSGGVQVTVEMN